MTLATAKWPSGGGGGRLPNPEEEKAFELWEKLGLKRDDFNPHNLVAFFKQVRKILGRRAAPAYHSILVRGNHGSKRSQTRRLG
jgi:hypothetical protein